MDHYPLPTKFVDVTLPNGETIKAEVALLDPEEKVGDTGFDLVAIQDKIKGIAQALVEPLKAVKPDKIGVTIGLELGVESGKLTALFVKGTGKTNLSISLDWEPERS